MINMTVAALTIDPLGWLLVVLITLVVGIIFVIVIAPALGINLKKGLEKITNMQQGIVEETENFKLVETPETTIIDVMTNREDEVPFMSKNSANKVTMYTISETGKPQFFKENLDNAMFEAEDVVAISHEIPGLRWKLNTENSVGKMRMLVSSLRARVKVLEAEKASQTVNVKEEMVKHGENLKAIRQAAYGSSKPTGGGRLGDRFGFGSRYGIGGGDDSGDEGEG